MAFNGLVWRIMYRICVDLSLGKTYYPILGTKGGDPGESGWIRHVWCAKMKNHGRYFNHIQSKSKSTCQAIQSIYSIYQESWRQVTNKLTQALQPDSQYGWNPGRPKPANLKIRCPTNLMIIFRGKWLSSWITFSDKANEIHMWLISESDIAVELAVEISPPFFLHGRVGHGHLRMGCKHRAIH